jgi:hypothetical protein
VESVDDEWDLNPDAVDLDDLLFVTYNADKIKQEQLLEAIQEEGFEPVIR